MSETNMRSINQAVSGHLVALARVVGELQEIEEQLREETLFPHMETDVSEVRHTVRLAARRLAELNAEYGLHADARDPSGSDALSSPRIIDQPVSPARVPEVKQP